MGITAIIGVNVTPVSKPHRASNRMRLDDLADALSNSKTASVRQVGSLLRNKEVDAAAAYAREQGHWYLSLTINRKAGNVERIVEMLHKDKGNLNGAIGTYMDMGMPVSAFNLALNEGEMEKVYEVTDRTVNRSRRILDFSPTMVEMLLGARDAALLQHYALGLAGLRLGGRNHIVEKERLIEAAAHYQALAKEIGREGMEHFSRVGEHKTALKLSDMTDDTDSGVRLVRNGLERQGAIGHYDAEFLESAKELLFKMNGALDPTEKERLLARIEEQKGLGAGSRNGKVGLLR